MKHWSRGRAPRVNSPSGTSARSQPASLLRGYRADLILLSANPIENIRNARAIVGVMARGKLIDN
jgi:hypothetical protein